MESKIKFRRDLTSDLIRYINSDDGVVRWELHNKLDFYNFSEKTPMSDKVYNIIKREYMCGSGAVYDYKNVIRTRQNMTSRREDNYIEVDEKKVKKEWKDINEKVVVEFPHSYDITPDTVVPHLAVMVKLIRAGYHLLIKCRPQLACIEEMSNVLWRYKSSITWLFTFCTKDDKKLRDWELYSSTYSERVKCMQYLRARKYDIALNVVIVVDDPRSMIKELSAYVTSFIYLDILNLKNNPYESKLFYYEESNKWRFIKDIINECKNDNRLLIGRKIASYALENC